MASRSFAMKWSISPVSIICTVQIPRLGQTQYMTTGRSCRGQLYGNGFTYAMTLDFDLGQVDRDGILAKILDHAYDLVIFGSIYRNPTFFREVPRGLCAKGHCFY